MTAKNDPEKKQAMREAEELTQRKLQIIRSYRKLRYDYVPDRSRAYYFSKFERDYQKYKPKQNVNKWWDARKSLQIGFVTSIKALLKSDDRKAMDNRLEEEKMRLQEQVDEENQREYGRCKKVNNRIDNQIANRIQDLANGSIVEAKRYFSAVIQSDDYSLDGKNRCEVNSSVSYDQSLKMLVIDYQLPTPDDIPNTKEWKVDKNGEPVEVPFPKGEFLVLYERIILDLAIRVIGLAFGSDDLQILSEIVFSGYCIFANFPDDETFIISMLVTRKEFETSNIRRADFSSKVALSKFSRVVYLGDINADTPPKGLTDPLSDITPIRSNIDRQ